MAKRVLFETQGSFVAQGARNPTNESCEENLMS